MLLADNASMRVACRAKREGRRIVGGEPSRQEYSPFVAIMSIGQIDYVPQSFSGMALALNSLIMRRGGNRCSRGGATLFGLIPRALEQLRLR
jgi:hypothetical protein